MQPEKVGRNLGLNQVEAIEDGTALLGTVDSRQTDRFDAPGGSRQARPEAVGQVWHRISARPAELFATGVADNDARTQQAIHEHYRWIFAISGPRIGTPTSGSPRCMPASSNSASASSARSRKVWRSTYATP